MNIEYSEITSDKNNDSFQAPHNFKEMFEPNEGDTLWQRLAKCYFKPIGNPDTTIKVLEVLQVHQFQKIPRAMVAFHSRGRGRLQTTYTIRDSQLVSLIDYGVDKSVFNEVVHTGALMGINVPLGALTLVTGDDVGLAINMVGVLFNTYLILAQRYSRARCERLIDKSLRLGKVIDRYEYENILNLKLP